MNIFKQSLLSFYYHGSLPMRAIRNRALAVSGRAPIMVLMYHRIADDRANAWTTDSNVFDRQIAWLRERFDMLSLADAQERIRSTANHRPAVSITFDDGYAVNCQRALPMLIDQAVPFTYFVTSDPVLKGSYFPHDLAMGNRFEANSLKQLKALADAGVEIGAHTRTHPDLGAVTDEATLVDEVVTARQELSDALSRPVRYFAFPFGQHKHLNRRGFEIAADAGYEAVVSAYGGYNFPGDDAFHIQRMGVDGPMVRLKNWTTLDPFKQWKIPRYSYRPSNGRRERLGVAAPSRTTGVATG